jgi:hypothetical protein
LLIGGFLIVADRLVDPFPSTGERAEPVTIAAESVTNSIRPRVLQRCIVTAMSQDAMVRTVGLTKAYGSFVALREVNLDIRQG